MRRAKSEMAPVPPIPMLRYGNNPEHNPQLSMVRFYMAKSRTT